MLDYAVCQLKAKRLGLLLIIIWLSINSVHSAPFCANKNHLQHTFSSRSSWDLCWHMTKHYGVLLHHVYYKHKDSSRRKVLHSGLIAAITNQFQSVKTQSSGDFQTSSIVIEDCAKQIPNIPPVPICILKGQTASVKSYLQLQSRVDSESGQGTLKWTFFEDGVFKVSFDAHSIGDRNLSAQSVLYKLDFDLGLSGSDDFLAQVDLKQQSFMLYDQETTFHQKDHTQLPFYIYDGQFSKANRVYPAYKIKPISTNRSFYLSVTKSESCGHKAIIQDEFCPKQSLDSVMNNDHLLGQDIVIWLNNEPADWNETHNQGSGFYFMPTRLDGFISTKVGKQVALKQLIAKKQSSIKSLQRLTTKLDNSVPQPWQPPEGESIVLSSDDLNQSTQAPPIEQIALVKTSKIEAMANKAMDFVKTNLTQTKQNADIPVLTVSDAPPDKQVQSNQQNRPDIKIDGKSEDWNPVVFFTDRANEHLAPVDVETIAIAESNTALNIALRGRNNIVGNELWAWQMMLDTDYKKQTGLQFFDMGGDYLLKGKELYQYQGQGGDWTWQYIGSVDYAVQGNFAEFAIDTKMIGQIERIKLTFYGANHYANGSKNDFFYLNLPDIKQINHHSSLVIDGYQKDWQHKSKKKDNQQQLTAPVDYQTVWFDQDEQYAYFAYQNRTKIDPALFWAWIILIDSDQQLNTGLNYYRELGADYLLMGDNLFRYVGHGNDWKWSEIGEVSSMINENFAEFAVPKSALKNAKQFRLMYFGSNRYAKGSQDEKLLFIPES